jgi:hypothetical protein
MRAGAGEFDGFLSLVSLIVGSSDPGAILPGALDHACDLVRADRAAFVWHARAGDPVRHVAPRGDDGRWHDDLEHEFHGVLRGTRVLSSAFVRDDRRGLEWWVGAAPVNGSGRRFGSIGIVCKPGDQELHRRLTTLGAIGGLLGLAFTARATPSAARFGGAEDGLAGDVLQLLFAAGLRMDMALEALEDSPGTARSHLEVVAGQLESFSGGLRAGLYLPNDEPPDAR